MNAPKIVHYPCGDINPYNRLLTESLRGAGLSVEMRTAVQHSNPARCLEWAWGAELIHLHWIQGLYMGRSLWRFIGRSGIFLLVLAGLRLSGTQIVLTVHNLVPHEHSHRLLHRLVNMSVGRIVHRLIVHSEPAAKAVNAEYFVRKKVCIIEHIDYGEPASELNLPEARQKLRLPESRKLVLFFGSIRPYKGVDNLFAAANGLDAIGCDIVIVGRPFNEIYQAELEAASTLFPNVHLRLGGLSNEDLSQYLRATDIVVLPYSDGLSSGAAHLALTHFKPILCSYSVAFQHLAELGIAIACKPTFPEDICQKASIALHTNTAQWRNTVEIYRQKCHRDMVGPRLKAVYQELLGGAA